jgi:hypothetical protein
LRRSVESSKSKAVNINDTIKYRRRKNEKAFKAHILCVWGEISRYLSTNISHHRRQSISPWLFKQFYASGEEDEDSSNVPQNYLFRELPDCSERQWYSQEEKDNKIEVTNWLLSSRYAGMAYIRKWYNKVTRSLSSDRKMTQDISSSSPFSLHSTYKTHLVIFYYHAHIICVWVCVYYSKASSGGKCE